MAGIGYKRRRALGGNSSILPKLVISLGIWLGFPTVVAYQDMLGLVTSQQNGDARWTAYVERSVAGSVHHGEMPFLDAIPTGSIDGSGMEADGVGKIAFRAKGPGKLEETPDEDRVNRVSKRGRLANVAPVAPPRMFNAGSILDRTSSLHDIKADPDMLMAFVLPEISGQEIEIAGQFHMREALPPAGGVSSMLAELVTNDRPDILATAYAPTAPDYSASSPFTSLLKGEKEESAGRFIPPMSPRDHAWMAKPLPEGVFGNAEQKCLAEAIYFEARSESLKGQAAVAQVVLNRVRNPTYPGTICGVVYQNRHWRNRCQFSFACEGRRLTIRSPRHFEVAEELAMAVTAGKIFLPEIGSSTHYHATYVSPRWARSMERLERIGLHIFYRTRGGGWS